MIKLIATDLDGTLLSDNKKIPDDFPQVLKQLKERGIVFAVASGRDYNGAAQFFGSLVNDMVFICDNGANIYKGETNIVSRMISRENKANILNALKEMNNSDFIMCGIKGTYYTHGSDAFMAKMAHHYSPTTFVDDVSEIDDSIFRISVYDNSGDIREKLYVPLAEKFSESNTIHISADVWIDIMDKTADKGVGIKYLQNECGADYSETMAFGDFYNDIPLLDSAEYAFVMDNAKDDLKRMYKYHAESCNEGGVTKAIKEWALK